jgi:phosphatidylglycerol:prolipoprotein diacylglycerol transferase
MYLAALVVGILFLHYFASKSKDFPLKKEQILDFVFWVFLGVIVGGRLGNVVFYHPEFYLKNPLEIFAIWKGGMSFHGGMIGVIIATIAYCKKYQIHTLKLTDYLVIPVAIGLMLGRFGNFLNGELWGKPSNLPFCINYSESKFITRPPQGCRHPSQIYAAIKDFVIFLVLFGFYKFKHNRKTGTISFLFLILYGIFRSTVEIFREPSWVYLGITAGQWLSLPLIVIGTIGMIYIHRKRTI